jgi:hypothetical protein
VGLSGLAPIVRAFAQTIAPLRAPLRLDPPRYRVHAVGVFVRATFHRLTGHAQRLALNGYLVTIDGIETGQRFSFGRR